MAATSATSSFLTSPTFAPPRPAAPARLRIFAGRKTKPAAARICCEAATSATAVSSAAGDGSSRVGAKVRVKTSVKVYHVQKAPELDLLGLEGVIKQYVGTFKGQTISPNLPFKVEFNLPGPIKFLAHLREDELEFLSSE